MRVSHHLWWWDTALKYPAWVKRQASLPVNEFLTSLTVLSLCNQSLGTDLKNDD